MDVCLLFLLCVVRWSSLRQADHSSRGILPTVVRLCVWSRNFANEEAMTHWELSCQKQFWINLMSLHKLVNSQTSLSSPLFKLSPRIEVRNVAGYKIKVFIFLENLTCVLLSAQYFVCMAVVIPQSPHHFKWNSQCKCHKPLSQYIITAAMYQRPSVHLNPPTCRCYIAGSTYLNLRQTQC